MRILFVYLIIMFGCLIFIGYIDEHYDIRSFLIAVFWPIFLPIFLFMCIIIILMGIGYWLKNREKTLNECFYEVTKNWSEKL